MDEALEEVLPPDTDETSGQPLTEEISKVEGNGDKGKGKDRDGDTPMGGTKEEQEQDFEEMEGLQDEDLDGSDMDHDRSDHEDNNDDDHYHNDDPDDLSTLDYWDNTTEPNIIANEDGTTFWGKCYFGALQQDLDFGEGTQLREPFYRNQDGFILKRHDHRRPRVYIPKGRIRIGGEEYDMRELLIHSAHGRLGHFGLKKTYNDLRDQTIWRGQWEQTRRFIQRCDVCQRTKQPTQKPAGIAQMLQIPDGPWQSISIDFLGPLPLSNDYRHVMVVVDRFSSATRLIPMHDKYTSRDICNALLLEIYSRLGRPTEIITDRGPQFVSNFFTEMQEAFGVHLLPSTAYHQNTNGSAERAIKAVTQILRAYTNRRQNDWADHLWRAEYAINNSSTEWTNRTPNDISLGRPTHLAYSESRSDAVNQHLEHLSISNKIAHDALTMYRYAQARHSQGRRNPEIVFDVGDLVMYQARTNEKGLAKKLRDIWRGPYRVTAIDKHGNCTLDLPGSQRRHPVFATDMLKHYHDNPEHQREPADSSDIDMDEAGGRYYVLEFILDHRVNKRKDDRYEYLCKWKGYDDNENTWEPISADDFDKIEHDAP
jgi:transposase InsO family protein